MQSANIIKLVEGTLNDLSVRYGNKSPDYLPPYSILKELKSLRITLPRALGHSTAALELLQKYPSAIWIVPNTQIRRYVLKENARNMDYTNIDERVLAWTQHEHFYNSHIINNANIIIFDPYSGVQKELAPFHDLEIETLKRLVETTISIKYDDFDVMDKLNELVHYFKLNANQADLDRFMQTHLNHVNLFVLLG